ncbi:TadE/TadG family type IV pilus assembly protein [Prosthecomicrobium sp. N25]|uniref:TadE/TadG family type IV pilus assembly protein n=1 Tax=Prosthecomicrobium sp. N25 TaxID=3129254 RepID=UPI0030773B7D
MSRANRPTFARDERGGIAIAFALLLLPILVAMGCAIDYGRAVAFKTRFQAAADDGALAVLSPDFKEQGANAVGSDFFLANLAQTDLSMLVGPPKVTVSKSSVNGIVTSTVAFEASIATTFLKIAQVDSIQIAGSATAENGTKKYIDIHVLLDSSDSMGVGASEADRLLLRQVSAKKKAELRDAAIDKLKPGETLTATYLYADTEDTTIPGFTFLGYDKLGKGLTGCEFACHTKTFNYSGTMESLAHDAGVTLRFNVAKAGIKQVSTLAAAAKAQDTYVRMGLSTFSTTLVKHLDPNADLNAFQNKISNAADVTLGSGGTASESYKAKFTLWNNCWNGYANTFFDMVAPEFAGNLAKWRDKAASKETAERVPTQVVLLVTDGLKSQNCASSAGSGGREAVFPIRPADCAKLKATGAQVAVVYTEYINSPLPTYKSHARHAVEEAQAYPYADTSKSSGIEKNLRACATPGLFAKGKEPAEIDAAFKTVFENIRITPFLSH